jgi:predicted HTH domain antitoxin
MDDTVTLVFDLPREVIPLTGGGERDLPQTLKKLLALELLRQGTVTYGKAAELLGIGQAEFISFLGEHQVSIFQFAPDELRQEVMG